MNRRWDTSTESKGQGRPTRDKLCIEPSFFTEQTFLDIRPKLFSQIAQQIEPECCRALDKPEAHGIEPVGIPQVGKKGGAIIAADAPGGQRFATTIGAREDGSAQRTSRPAPEPGAARSIVPRVLMQRRV